MPTTYDIAVTVTYDYDNPAAASRHMLRLLPATLPGQQLVSGLLEADPRPDYRRDTRDFFGNAITEMVYESRLDEIRFRFSGRVRRETEAVPLDLSPDLAGLSDDIIAVHSLDPLAPHHYLGTSERVRPDPEITAFAEAHASAGMSATAVVRAIASALHHEMTFDPEATEVATRPIEAFRRRRGVCQDFSHIMIAALRGIGIPAGYVSGLIRTIPPPGRARLEGSDAMHAWVKAWCGAEAGWLQIDPTNDMLAGDDHIIVATGRDYSDVAPVKGALRSVGEHMTQHKVDVVAVA